MGNVMTNKKNTKLKFILMLAAVIVVGLLAFFMLSGGNLQLLKSLFFEEHSSEELKAQMSDLKLRGFISIAVLSALQVVMTFLPAEPTQVLAGAAFGIPLGLLCCLIGVLIGNSLIYLLCRFSGNKLREYFVTNLQFNFDKATHSKKTTFLIFILYFLPAIPYGMICFLAATVNKSYLRFITITMLGSIPSVCIGVGLGHVATASSWIVTVLVFLVIVALLVVLKFKKDWIFQKINAYVNRLPYDSQTAVQKCNGFILDFAWIV
ncbi:MAG: VTT domain-containing protein, partial [Clostridia bacterium]|nr:VTT domain-containing protein [Clostridia bacterium]